ncbi:MAG: GIY-YIG nuclease family protein [Woeseiaceae bacterium]
MPKLRRQSGASSNSNTVLVVSVSTYSVYLLRCADGSLYTGIATDVARRICEHEKSARGAKYLRGRGPLQLAYEQEVGNRSDASRVEGFIKSLAKKEKEALVAGRISLAEVTSSLRSGQASGIDGG